MTVKLNGNLDEGDEVPVIQHTKPVVNHKIKIFWRIVFIVTYLHLAGIYGFYLAFTIAKWQTLLFVCLLYAVTKLGVCAGAHRLWSHKSYKAKLPLRLFLMFAFTLAFEGNMYGWVRDHRLHHKFQETDADPHNVCRGFWFAHLLWFLQKKHPEVLEKGKKIVMDDLKNEKMVMFQKKYYWQMAFVIGFVMPMLIPWFFWDESLNTCWYVAVCLTHVITLNGTWVVNSFAHMYGNKPFEKRLYAGENPIVAFISLGEGWHNFHHAFPWDYRASEMGIYGLNLTAVFITAMSKIGWAYDLKTVSASMVRKRALRTGDGSYKDKKFWGWDDTDLPDVVRTEATIINSKDDQ